MQWRGARVGRGGGRGGIRFSEGGGAEESGEVWIGGRRGRGGWWWWSGCWGRCWDDWRGGDADGSGWRVREGGGGGKGDWICDKEIGGDRGWRTCEEAW